MNGGVFAQQVATGGGVFEVQVATYTLAAPTGAVTAQALLGAALSISGTAANAVSAALSVAVASPDNGAVAVAPIAGTVVAGVWSFSVVSLSPGSYLAPLVTLTGPGGTTAVSGAPFELVPVDGTPTAPSLPSALPGAFGPSLLTASCALIAGAAAGAAARPTITLQAVAGLLQGTATTTTGSTSPPHTLVASAVLLPGVAATATAIGAQLVVAGAALLPGAVTVGTSAAVAGRTLAVLSSLFGGDVSLGSVVAPTVLVRVATLLPGTPGGGVVLSGASLAATAALVAGQPRGGAAVPGLVLVAGTSLQTDSVVSGGAVLGRTLSVVPALIPGEVMVALASRTLTAVASLNAGVASVGAFVTATRLVAVATLSPGQVEVASAQAGTVFTVRPILLSGVARGGVAGEVPPTVLYADLSLFIVGQARVFLSTPEVRLVLRTMLLPGRPAGEVSIPAHRLTAKIALVADRRAIATGDKVGIAPPGRRYKVWK